MTKENFIALADALKTRNPVYNRGVGDSLYTEGYEAGRVSHHSEIVDLLADFCRSQNPQFNRERWLAYIAGECGPNGGTIKPLRTPRPIKPERKLARRLEGN